MKVGRITILETIHNDIQLSAFCGVRSLKGFNQIADTVERVLVRVNYTHQFKLDYQSMLFLCLTKLKTNLSFTAISAMLEISRTTCISYFHFMIDVLYGILKPFIRWPSKEEIRKTLPDCFKKYPNTRIVLDSSETPIDKFHCLSCRIRSYSNYKGRETIKYMLGIAPSGLVSFIGCGYGGKASDKFIFNDCGLKNLLRPRDGVMVDKGFLIEDELNSLQCEMIRPPFLRGGKQMTKENSLMNKDVAAARVHIERAFERFKNFHVLSDRMPRVLLCKDKETPDKVLKIIAALINLETPILSFCRPNKYANTDKHIV